MSQGFISVKADEGLGTEASAKTKHSWINAELTSSSLNHQWATMHFIVPTVLNLGVFRLSHVLRPLGGHPRSSLRTNP